MCPNLLVLVSFHTNIQLLSKPTNCLIGWSMVRHVFFTDFRVRIPYLPEWQERKFLLIHFLIYWGLLHNRADIYTFSVNRADIFVCAMMWVVSLWQNIAFLYTWHVCMCWVRSAVVVPQWNGRPERTENLHPVLFYSSKNQHLRLIKCLKKHFMMLLWAECEHLNGTSVSKVTRFQLRILNIYVTDCQIRLMKTWKKCA